MVYDTLKGANPDLNLDPTNSKKQEAFQCFLIYLCIAAYSNEKVDMLNICERDYPKEMEEHAELSAYAKKFLAFEITSESMEEISAKLGKYQPF